MSFPRYPAYKPSGVEWLGDVPEHWEVGPIKRLIQKVESGTSVNASDEPAEGGKLGVLKTSCVYAGTFDPDENKTVVDEDIGRVSCPLKAGTLIVSRMNTPELIGAAGLVTQTRDNLYLPDRLWQVSFSNADPHFVHYWTLTSLYRGHVKAVCTGTSSSMKNLGQDQFGAFSFAAPPPAEQTAIAAFLDRETGKIDALVAEQRRLMELLKEKRQAVISHAVTRGLNPKAKLKPSGIEWFGEVPQHWSLGFKLKTLAINRPAAFTNGPFGSDLLTSELQEEGVPVIYIRDLKVGGYCRTSSSYVTAEKAKELDKFRVDSGDILIAKVGDPPGFCCTYPSEEPPGIICQDVIRMKPNTELIDSDYICFLLNSRPGMESIDSVCIQLTRKRFSLEDLHSLRLPIPPKEEQFQIAAFLREQAAKFEALTAEAQRAIDLLQERRTALISAAVTGQIDVREAALSFSS